LRPQLDADETQSDYLTDNFFIVKNRDLSLIASDTFLSHEKQR